MTETRRKTATSTFRFRKSAALLRTMMENAAIGMALVGIDGRVIYANRSWSTMFGYEPDACVGLGPSDVAQPEDQHQTVDELGRLTRGEIDAYRAERRYRRQDGTEFW